MRQIRLTRQERNIENALVRGEYQSVPKAEFEDIARAVAHRHKDAILNIRINSDDLMSIKQKARGLGVKYQAFISELLHRVAHS